MAAIVTGEIASAIIDSNDYRTFLVLADVDSVSVSLRMPAHVAAAMADAFAKATAEGDRIAAVVEHARAVA
jgi:hypothetical protein